VSILALAWRNIWRNKRRSLLTLMAVAASCTLLIFMMAMQKGSYASMIKNTVGAQTGHIQVQHVDYIEDGALESALSGPGDIMAAVSNVPGVLAVAPRISAPVLASHSNHTFGALLLGVDPELEKGFSKIPHVVSAGRWLKADDKEGVVLGHLLATNLAVGVGDELVFLGQGRDGSTAAARQTVRGVFRFGMDEMDRAVLVGHIAMLQETHAMEDAATAVAVMLTGDRQRTAAAAAMRAALKEESDLAVREWPELLPGVMQTIRMDWNTGLIMYAVLVLVVAFGVANTFLMAFLERIREYGVLLSLGMGPVRMGLMAYTESVLLTLAGLAVGTGLGSAWAYWLQVQGWEFAAEGHLTSKYGVDPILYGELSWEVVGWAVGIVFVMTVAMAVYPAAKASRLRPVEAMRHL
jgi:putative ABC transport system permease protein